MSDAAQPAETALDGQPVSGSQRSAPNLKPEAENLDSKPKKLMPETKKLHELIRVRQDELERLLESSAPSTIEEQQANTLLAFNPEAARDNEDCHERLDKLDELAPRLGDRHFVFALLETELWWSKSDAEKRPLLKELFSEAQLQHLQQMAEQYRNGGASENDLQQVRASLGRLSRERNDSSRHERVTAAEKRRLVRWPFLPELFVLTLLFGTFAVVADWRHEFWSYVLFAASAGALGGTLGGALDLRETFEWDEVKRLRQAIVLQPLIGAAAGLVVFFAYLQIHGPIGESKAWLAAGLSAFAGGFSESVFLQTVGKLTSSMPSSH
jgi:hypothetical protein